MYIIHFLNFCTNKKQTFQYFVCQSPLKNKQNIIYKNMF